MVAERVSDRRVLKLVHQWLSAGVMDDAEVRRSVAGTPQGGVISPLLSNIYLHALDRAFADGAHGRLVRYVDDFVVMCRSDTEARLAAARARRVLAGLGLVLHPIKALTGRNRVGADIRDVIADLNPILRGWGNHFRTGNAAAKFVQIDSYVWRRLARLTRQRYGRNLRPGQWKTWTREWFEGHGLIRLRGTVRYPVAAS